jgi:hypothetical protein
LRHGHDEKTPCDDCVLIGREVTLPHTVKGKI